MTRPAATTAPAAPGAPPPEAVTPLIRGLAVLRRLAAADGRLGVGDLVRATGLARSTVDRTLSTLARLGYVRLEDRRAVLAPPLMELGNVYLAAIRLPGELGPLVDRLANEFDESVSLAVPDGDGVRFVYQATRRRTMSLAFRIGDLLPAESGAPGALFAADWDRDDWARWRDRRERDPAGAGFPAVPPEAARAAGSFERRIAEAGRRGWSADDQLIEPGLIAVAIPVRDGAGRAVCAASVVSHTSRHDVGSLADQLLPRLREAVAEMEATLAAPPPPRPADEPADAPAGGPHGELTRAAKRELGPEFVESLARGLGVLAAFDRVPGATDGVTLAALAQATGLARATVRRALITLEHLGYVRGEGRRFHPEPRVLELGYARLAGLPLSHVAQPHLVGLVARAHDSASLSVLVGDEIQYAARVPTVRIMSVDITVGTRFPAHATSMGRVLLAGLPADERAARLARLDLTPLTRHTITSPDRLRAELDRVAEAGYALVDEELEEGLRSLAVPVRDGAGRVVAAVNVSMHASRRTPERAVTELLPALREAAAGVERDLRVAGRFTRVRIP
ncbi:IclR family transcriptional regulator [Streptomyces sp. 8K308]|uniref:IclR family transcriptional regulator domain-containing protein n=1 Tax=Streptomyces sp. 8K308 TaxID=2530388 RepID=UPI00104B6FF1|nr:IclR family transcriptional regulator C-terminal domain-containing protein [Streptomyces sp. 8K308]TDC24012.1 IclR family transcriptional regulator [Streptomyces sp. 8K308]